MRHSTRRSPVRAAVAGTIAVACYAVAIFGSLSTGSAGVDPAPTSPQLRVPQQASAPR